MSFEDPTQLARCIKSDCDAYRAGGSPLCAQHLREQEVSAGATSIVEPEVEARVALVKTEDDMHAGQKKVYNDDGTSEWVDDPRYQPPGELYVGPDPDTNGMPDYKVTAGQMRKSKELLEEALRLDVPTWDEKVGITPEMRARMPERPGLDDLEPHWDGEKWILRAKHGPAAMACPHCGERITVKLS